MMTDDTLNPDTAQSPDVEPQAATESAAPETAAQAEAPAPETEAETPALDPKVAALEAELAAAKERAIRLLADFDNLRKRTARELEERTARANERLLKDLLPVFDHFELALAAGDDSPFAQGVRMIAEEFRKVLEQSGAEVIDASAEGTTVDPMVHEVLSMVPHATIAQGCVVSQFRKGWRLGGKVVRPAQVIVSAGAPEAPAEPPKAE